MSTKKNPDKPDRRRLDPENAPGAIASDLLAWIDATGKDDPEMGVEGARNAYPELMRIVNRLRAAAGQEPLMCDAILDAWPEL